MDWKEYQRKKHHDSTSISSFSAAQNPLCTGCTMHLKVSLCLSFLNNDWSQYVGLILNHVVTNYIEELRRKENYNKAPQFDTNDPRSKSEKGINSSSFPPSSPSFQPQSTMLTLRTWPLGSKRHEPVTPELKGLQFGIAGRLKKTLRRTCVADLQVGSGLP
jgi:hypothetical protein